jgi:hypothetical protein
MEATWYAFAAPAKTAAAMATATMIDQRCSPFTESPLAALP